MTSVFHSKKVLTPEGIKEAYIFIVDGKITDVKDTYTGDFSMRIEDFGDKVIMPGIIDTHVHINEPGRTEWEGFITATKSAAAGGITTLIDMPLNSSPTTINKSSFEEKLLVAKNKLYVNVGFYGGLVHGNADKLEELVKGGVTGIKAFMIDSGIDEFPFAREEDLREAMSVLSNYNIPLLVHAELESPAKLDKNLDPSSFSSFLKNRPAEWETDAIRMLIMLCKVFTCHVHIVHVSSGDSIELIRKAKNDGLNITAETCPHYLFFSAEDIPDKDTRFKCTPPIRDKENQNMLWKGLNEGVLDMIVSDHSPCDPELKEMESCNFEKAWGGISGLQFSLPVVWTEAKKRGISLEKISELMSVNPAKLAGLDEIKGKIAKGFDADFVIFSPEKTFTVIENIIQHKHKITPYTGTEFYGLVEATLLNGVRVFDGGSFSAEKTGKELLRNNIKI
ncbi:allantoinase AllB [soil metagenome]